MRADANRLREALWASGIYPNMPTSEFDAEQWRVWEEDWAMRIVLYTRDWSLRREDGTPLPIDRPSVEEMEDSNYQRICTKINDILLGRSPEEAKREEPDGKRLGEGDEAGGSGAGVATGVSTNGVVGKVPSTSLA
jgi:hypothetical protein